MSFGNRKLAAVMLMRALTLLDLRKDAAINAGTKAAISGDTGYPVPQAWSRYFYEHPDLYWQVDGLIYEGAHNGDDSIALYERADSCLLCYPEKGVWRLDDLAIAEWVAKAMKRARLLPDPDDLSLRDWPGLHYLR